MHPRLIKLPFLFLAAISLSGIIYFSIPMWRSGVGFAALVATVVPILVAWGGIMWISIDKTWAGCIRKFVIVSTVAWGWLYVGSIYIGVLRLQ